MTDDNDYIDYARLIDEAMRGVVKNVLNDAAKNGLPGEHHFYISFDTNYPGVQMSEMLRARYPEEMTIVIQHQYWDLRVENGTLYVTLSFNNIPEKLVVPLSAITAFADPSIKFGLQFHHEGDFDEDDLEALPFMEEEDLSSGNDDDKGGKGKPEKAEILTLDAFRKK